MAIETKENLIANAEYCMQKALMYLADTEWYLQQAGRTDEAFSVQECYHAAADKKRVVFPSKKTKKKGAK